MGLAMTVIRIAAIPDLPSSLGVRTVMLSYEVVRVEAGFQANRSEKFATAGEMIE